MTTEISLRTIKVDGVDVFYREAGLPTNPTILLLHGFPTSSLMFRNLIPLLTSTHHLVAPDLPGFGFTSVPDERKYKYTFDALAATVGAFVDALHLTKYAIYIFDYGAPTGLRLALAHPEKVTAIITQNGNAYEEGLGDAWAPIKKYWAEPTPDNRKALLPLFTFDTTKWQYTHGVEDPSLVAPETYHLDTALLARPGNADIQLDLFLDYANNIKLYPSFQQYFREHAPRTLVVWGKNDAFFIPPGAQAFKKDIPNTEVHLLNTGHFALETHVKEIAAAIIQFLSK